MSGRTPIEYALEIALPQLSAQRDELRNLRNQASFAAGITAIISAAFASILGEKFIDKLSLDPSFLGVNVEAWIVFSSLFLTLFFACLVVAGWRECTFDFELGWFVTLDAHSDDWKEQVIRASDEYFVKNELVIEMAQTNLKMSLLLALCQFISWCVFSV